MYVYRTHFNKVFKLCQFGGNIASEQTFAFLSFTNSVINMVFVNLDDRHIAFEIFKYFRVN